MPQFNNDSVLVFGVTDFVAVFNQTLEKTYPNINIVGELANFRVSKNRWVYFDLKDELSSVKFFGSVYNLSGPLEDGMLLQVHGQPRLHPLFGFSINIMSIQPVGEGSLKKAAQLLEAKLRAEGLFEPERKRTIPYPPQNIGLITSVQSAAYADFIKILNERWSGVTIELADVQVQGEPAPNQIVAAIKHFNQEPKLADVLVLTRGGGAAEDLAAFNNEQVTRAVAASRIPTLVAIGHEVDISLAELAADQRASTPSNAAQLLVPDKRHEHERMKVAGQSLSQYLNSFIKEGQNQLANQTLRLNQIIVQYISTQEQLLSSKTNLLKALNPKSVLARGYSILRQNGRIIRSVKQIKLGDTIDAQLNDGQITTRVEDIGLQ